MGVSRRQFLNQCGLAAVGGTAFLKAPLFASPMNQPIGFQNFEIFSYLKQDWQGTWNKMASFGYKFVDMLSTGPMANRTPAELKATFKEAGLTVDTCHFPHAMLTNSFEKTLAFAQEMGLKNMVCSPAPRLAKGPTTADDWKWMANELNQIGARTKAHGLVTGYHNHDLEFRAVENQIPYDILMQNTDPGLVRYQIDVGNLAFGGADPKAYLSRYPDRYFSMHCKDLQPGKAGVPVGAGILDWNGIFALAAKAKIMSYIAEVGEYTVGPASPGLAPDDLDTLEAFRRSFIFLNNFKPERA